MEGNKRIPKESKEVLLESAIFFEVHKHIKNFKGDLTVFNPDHVDFCNSIAKKVLTHESVKAIINDYGEV